ncbi:hypothetical protein HRbin22_02140 [Candidatus Thermoflexus japonica]|uniref:Uncharacterized protein n=1 Tax=Candidatus Thermoflexus japonica TaxID=2035417 RepID=A0A2H5Y924_9CHLR|nr:hypothetical protein HRbin22_02140 [Candidatus Thermoflexus japonica]
MRDEGRSSSTVPTRPDRDHDGPVLPGADRRDDPRGLANRLGTGGGGAGATGSGHRGRRGPPGDGHAGSRPGRSGAGLPGRSAPPPAGGSHGGGGPRGGAPAYRGPPHPHPDPIFRASGGGLSGRPGSLRPGGSPPRGRAAPPDPEPGSRLPNERGDLDAAGRGPSPWDAFAGRRGRPPGGRALLSGSGGAPGTAAAGGVRRLPAGDPLSGRPGLLGGELAGGDPALPGGLCAEPGISGHRPSSFPGPCRLWGSPEETGGKLSGGNSVSGGPPPLRGSGGSGEGPGSRNPLPSGDAYAHPRRACGSGHPSPAAHPGRAVGLCDV